MYLYVNIVDAQEKLSLKFHTLGALAMCFMCAYVLGWGVCVRESIYFLF